MCRDLPNNSNWSFDEIRRTDSDRAAALESASATDVAERVTEALDAAFECAEVRFGRERAEHQPNDYRAVIQFPVGTLVFDSFFNARTGYRAHFRACYRRGLAFNERIIEEVRSKLFVRLPDIVSGRELNDEFKDIGPSEIPKSFFIQSLAPQLAKVWFCTKRIEPQGGVEDLPIAIVGPRILLGSDQSWPAIYQDDEFAWLELKGAFVGEGKLYQPKDPTKRAKALETSGAA